jgi:hypothetical protein
MMTITKTEGDQAGVVEAKTETGDAVTDSAGKPIVDNVQPITPATVKSPADMTEAELIALFTKIGVKNPEKALAEVKHMAKLDKTEELKAIRNAEMAKLVAVHDEIVATLLPLLTKAGIGLDDNKQLRVFKGIAGSVCADIYYPEPLPDTKAKKSGTGEHKRSAPVSRGEVELVDKEHGIDTKVENGTQFLRYFSMKQQGYPTNVFAIEATGVFKCEHIPGSPETATTMAIAPRNRVTLTELGRKFFFPAPTSPDEAFIEALKKNGLTTVKAVEDAFGKPPVATVPPPVVVTDIKNLASAVQGQQSGDNGAIAGNQPCTCGSGKKFRKCCGKK